MPHDAQRERRKRHMDVRPTAGRGGGQNWVAWTARRTARGYSSRRTSIPDEPDGHGRGRKDGTSQGCLEGTSYAVVVKRDSPGSAVAWRAPCDGGKPPSGDV